MTPNEIFRYKVVLERNSSLGVPDVCIFYDENRCVALKEMQKYVKANGFTITEKRGRFSVADVLLVKCKLTGEIVSKTPYCKLFNVITQELL